MAQATVHASHPGLRPVACPANTSDLLAYSVVCPCSARNINMCRFAAPHHTAFLPAFCLYGVIQNTLEEPPVTATTPIARSKTAALTRVLDSIPKGYTRYTCGTISPGKANALAQKFHERYGIGCTPAQRVTRRKKGMANTLLVMYWPEQTEQVKWLLLATPGAGLEGETLRDVTDKPRLIWLGYELFRRAEHGRTAWSWRRPKEEMQAHFAMIAELRNKRQGPALTAYLQMLANQPGFHGVREQSWRLFEEARRQGYAGELPFLFHVQKTSHGERLQLSP